MKTSKRNTSGEATISLRFLDANRNLVLIIGRRDTPSNADGDFRRQYHPGGGDRTR